MRCETCNTVLSDEETRIRMSISGAFANMCRKCLDSCDIAYKLPKPHYEDDLLKDDTEELRSDNPFDEEYWDER